ncbi:FMN-binding negative transcriptional regulator [Alicyclobacillus cycloheptanicus]|uniref:Transcriptional regulator n=1 Tax=Alicyclobacillus cycloheptanicus TaxID=1457 RepID=A0ABT9XE00_9BACL|nr:FMN-binding negative transcriptional regulator [Alicyclobacillus cycloheptanicus]MDQ0188518.1 transcriptional regulator [Alicyclobacillus cycloheptanicus]WDM01204.1 FMN-binding negative transcriptional regulator [Alicyclobacillus cycloheptanicus]
MYVPKSFCMDNPDEITAFVHAHSFGVLVSTTEARPVATHLPLVYDAEAHCLFSHMAKANPQAQTLHGQDVLAIFSGAHAYISPAWYEVPAAVPTWNYTAVHMYGRCTRIEDQEALADLLERMIRFYEPSSSLPKQQHEGFYRNMMNAIVGFRIDVTDIQGAAKLSQNKSVEIRQRVVAQLRATGDVNAAAVAQAMEKRLPQQEA